MEDGKIILRVAELEPVIKQTADLRETVLRMRHDGQTKAQAVQFIHDWYKNFCQSQSLGDDHVG